MQLQPKVFYHCVLLLPHTLVSARSSVAGIRDSRVLVPLVYFDTLKQKMHFLSYTLRCTDEGSSLDDRLSGVEDTFSTELAHC